MHEKGWTADVTIAPAPLTDSHLSQGSKNLHNSPWPYLAKCRHTGWPACIRDGCRNDNLDHVFPARSTKKGRVRGGPSDCEITAQKPLRRHLLKFLETDAALEEADRRLEPTYSPCFGCWSILVAPLSSLRWRLYASLKPVVWMLPQWQCSLFARRSNLGQVRMNSIRSQSHSVLIRY